MVVLTNGIRKRGSEAPGALQTAPQQLTRPTLQVER